jgi:hypothetical protein
VQRGSSSVENGKKESAFVFAPPKKKTHLRLRVLEALHRRRGQQRLAHVGGRVERRVVGFDKGVVKLGCPVSVLVEGRLGVDGGTRAMREERGMSS